MLSESNFTGSGLTSKRTIILLACIWLFAMLTSRPASLSEPFLYDHAIKKEVSEINQGELYINYFNLLIDNPYNGQANQYLLKYVELHPESAPAKNGAISHLYKRNIRVGVPMLAKLFHLKISRIYLLQYVLAFLFLLLLFNIISIIDKANTIPPLLFCAAFAFTIIFKQFFIDFNHWDVYAWFFMIVAIRLALTGNLFFVLPFALALLTDERSFFSIPVIGLLLWNVNEADKKKLLLRFAIGVFFAVFILFGWRYYYAKHIAAQDISGITFSYLIYNSKAVASSLFLCYEFLWLGVYFLLYQFIRKRMFRQIALLLLCLLPGFIITFLVADLARSIGYLFPAFLLVYALLLQQTKEIPLLAKGMAHVAVLNGLFPSYYPFLLNSTISDYPPFWGFYEALLPLLEKIAAFLDGIFI